jgi:hypothetical protein
VKTGATGGDSITTLPLVSAPDNTSVRQSPSATDFPNATQGGVRAGVLFYCMPPNGTTQTDLLLSWK